MKNLFVNNIIFNCRNKLRLIRIRKKIIQYYSREDGRENSREIEEVLDYIKQRGASIFNYDFSDNYIKRKNQIYKDKKNGLYYLFHNGIKLYFKRGMSVDEINRYYNGICLEQDINSPHRYLDNSFDNFKGCIAVDIGAAEGNFSLHIIHKVEQIYIFECDENWIEALEATFKEYKHKVHIINKYVSDLNNNNSVALDDFFEDEIKKIDLIKMDIEGDEIKALLGASKIINTNDNITYLICSYHREDDEKNIKKIFENHSIKARKGWMLFVPDKNLNPPFFRRGVLCIKKKVKINE